MTYKSIIQARVPKLSSAMRTYGKYSKAQNIGPKILVETDFTDDIFSDSEGLTGDEKDDFDNTHQTSPDVSKDISSRASSIEFDSFKVLDGLDGKATKKRRITTLRKFTDEGSVDDGKGYEFQTTLKNVHKIISSLKTPDEVMEAYRKNMSEVSTTVASTHSRIKYGRSRTMLRNLEDEDAGEYVPSNAPDEPELHTGGNNTNSNLTSVIHINQLRNLGEALRFEDDLDFLKSFPSDKNVIFSKLLSFAIEIKSNNALLGFVKRYKVRQLWDWAFRIFDSADVPLCYFQLWLANTFPLDESDARWIPIKNLILICSYINEVQPPVCASKFISMNFKDFIRIEKYTNPKQLALEIWENFVSLDGTEKDNRILELLDEPNGQVLTILEKNVTSTSDPKFLMQCYTKLYKHVNDFINGSQFIKVLIKMTNNICFLESIRSNEKYNLIQLCLCTVIKEYPLVNEEDHIQDIIILQLGLVLNMITKVQMQYKKELVHNIRTMLPEMQDGTFLSELLQLVFVFLVISNELKLNHHELQSLRVSVGHLRDVSKDKNISIYEKATLGHNLLADI